MAAFKSLLGLKVLGFNLTLAILNLEYLHLLYARRWTLKTQHYLVYPHIHFDSVMKVTSTHPYQTSQYSYNFTAYK